MSLPPDWLAALEQPQLSVTSPYTLRLSLARLLRTEDPARVALLAGLRADTPGTAFLAAYQVAMRFVDPDLAPEQWAAFCVSEKGLRSLSSMATTLNHDTLNGLKSHALLAGHGVDWLYVVARLSVPVSDAVPVSGSESDPGSQSDKAAALSCVRVAPSNDGIELIASSGRQPFVPDVPHAAVCFQSVAIDPGYRVDEAHPRLNRPFRYHEDMLVLIALSGWVIRQLPAASVNPQLQASLAQVVADYRPESLGYDLADLDNFEQLAAQLVQVSTALSGAAAQQWQRDKTLLMMGQPAREALRQRFSAD